MTVSLNQEAGPEVMTLRAEPQGSPRPAKQRPEGRATPEAQLQSRLGEVLALEPAVYKHGSGAFGSDSPRGGPHLPLDPDHKTSPEALARSSPAAPPVHWVS